MLRKGRNIKSQVFSLLQCNNFDKSMAKILQLPPKKALNPLISALCSLNENIKWRAITAIGRIVSEMASKNMESARVVMRRLMWSLNDESGGIGWGAPEAMAEIMACNEDLAKEFSHILVSYIRKDANFLEYEPLQRGAVWGVGRLGSVRPELLLKVQIEKYLPGYLESRDSMVKGLAAWASGILGLKSVRDKLESLLNDNGEVTLFKDHRLFKKQVKQLAAESLINLNYIENQGKMA